MCVCVKGLTGKSGAEGPQGPVGMYVSDSPVDLILGISVYFMG